MQTHLAPFLRQDAYRPPKRRRSKISVECRHSVWPVNEIVLASLVHRGKSAAQIAVALGVSVDQVKGLREAYGI